MVDVWGVFVFAKVHKAALHSCTLVSSMHAALTSIGSQLHCERQRHRQGLCYLYFDLSPKTEGRSVLT